MSKVILGQELGKRLIEQLGLPDRIVQMGISIRAGEPVTMTIERMMGVDEAGGLIHELSRFGLAEIDPKDPIDRAADNALAEIRTRCQAALDWLDAKHVSNCHALAQSCC